MLELLSLIVFVAVCVGAVALATKWGMLRDDNNNLVPDRLENLGKKQEEVEDAPDHEWPSEGETPSGGNGEDLLERTEDSEQI